MTAAIYTGQIGPGAQHDIARRPLPFVVLPGSQCGASQATKNRAMSHVTPAELGEIVPDLRALAAVEPSDEVRAALLRLANRYAALAAGADEQMAA